MTEPALTDDELQSLLDRIPHDPPKTEFHRMLASALTELGTLRKEYEEIRAAWLKDGTFWYAESARSHAEIIQFQQLLHKARAFLAGPIDVDVQDAAHALAAQIWDYLCPPEPIQGVTVARAKRQGLLPMSYDVAADLDIYPADESTELLTGQWWNVA